MCSTVTPGLPWPLQLVGTLAAAPRNSPVFSVCGLSVGALTVMERLAWPGREGSRTASSRCLGLARGSREEQAPAHPLSWEIWGPEGRAWGRARQARPRCGGA